MSPLLAHRVHSHDDPVCLLLGGKADLVAIATSESDPSPTSSPNFAVTHNRGSHDVVGCLPRPEGSHEAPRVHHASWRRGGVAGRGARAAGRAAHRRADSRRVTIPKGKPGWWRLCKDCGDGLGGWPQRADRNPLDRRRSRAFADTRRIWSPLIRTSSWLAARPCRRCYRSRVLCRSCSLAPDPVGSGFVESLSQPGGNATGFIPFEFDRARNGWSCSKRSRPDYASGRFRTSTPAALPDNGLSSRSSRAQPGWS